MSPYHKIHLCSKNTFFRTLFCLFAKMDIYKCPKLSFPKKSWKKYEEQYNKSLKILKGTSLYYFRDKNTFTFMFT